MKIKVFFSILCCKLTRSILRLLGRGGTAFPGRVALKLCPDVLGTLSNGVRTILITGTNGKTTSARMIEQAFLDENLSYLANKSGANLISGITAEFAMHSTLSGKPKCQYAVIECDEAASKTVLKYLKPEIIVATNVFRDQLDRYGEITHTLNNIIEGVRGTPESLLCLNADCSLIASIPDEVPNPVVRFGVDVPLEPGDTAELSDAPHCIRCKTEYVYDYRTYGHLGGFRCPKCGYRREAPQYTVTAVRALDADSSDITMTIGGERVELHINLPAVYNIYNAAGAAAALSSFGFSTDVIARAGLLRLRLWPHGKIRPGGDARPHDAREEPRRLQPGDALSLRADGGRGIRRLPERPRRRRDGHLVDLGRGFRASVHDGGPPEADSGVRRARGRVSPAAEIRGPRRIARAGVL